LRSVYLRRGKAGSRASRPGSPGRFRDTIEPLHPCRFDGRFEPANRLAEERPRWNTLVMHAPERRFFWLVGLGLILCACAALPTRLDPPRVTVVDLRLVTAGVFSQTYRVRLNVQNPNSADLPIQGIAYELRFNGQPFATGVSGQNVTVPRYGTEVLEVEAIGTLADVLRQVNQLERERLGTFRYSLRGHVELRNGGTRLPFEQNGEISLVPDG
jgi:LEA14-like dessication related protein